MNKCIYDIQEFCFGVVFVPRSGHALFFLARDCPMTETQRQIFQWGRVHVLFLKKEAAAAFASVTANCRENKKDV